MSSSPSSSRSLKVIQDELASLRCAVDEALHVAHEALERVQQQRQEPCSLATEDEAGGGRPSSSSHALSEAALHEELRAFEAYIIRRVREESSRAVLAAGHPCGADVLSSRTTAATQPAPPVPTLDAAAHTRKVDLQLEAQRIRSAAAEQRLGQIELKLNALMTDVVAQAQRDTAHHKQLASTVREQVAAEVSAIMAAAPPAQQKQREASLSEPDLSLMHHVTAALAAMHQRVEEQHDELAQWQQQQYSLMEALAKQMNGLKEENVALRSELTLLQSGRRREDR